MPIAYPPGLRGALRSKVRTQPAAFALHEPRRGYAYAREIGTDAPVFWDVTFRFTRPEAIVFRLWFTQALRGGVEEFTLPLLTEFGLLEHTCRFLPDGLMPTRETGGTVEYAATIMARAEVIPEAYLAAADLIVGLPDPGSYGALLDAAMSGGMPAA